MFHNLPPMALDRSNAIRVANSYARMAGKPFHAVALPTGGFTVADSASVANAGATVVHTAEPKQCEAYRCQAHARHDSGLCSAHHDMLINAR